MKILFSAVAFPLSPSSTHLLLLPSSCCSSWPGNICTSCAAFSRCLLWQRRSRAPSACRNLCMFYVFAKNKKRAKMPRQGRGAGGGELWHATRIRHVCDDDDDDNNDEVDRRLWHKRCNDDADCDVDVDCDCDCGSDCVGTSSAWANINSKLLEWPLLSWRKSFATVVVA